jgi:hypothetical protein
VRLREFKERQRLDENPAIPPILQFLRALFGATITGSGATIAQPKVEKWVKDNPKQAKDFVDAVKPQVENPQSITNPIGNAIVKSWNWLTGGETQKDSVIKNQPPLSVPFKDRTPDAKEIKDKVNYDQYLNTTQGSTTADKLPPSTINNIRSSGDAGAGWVKQYDDLYKKRSQINKQIAADIKNGLTKQQLDAKYGDNLQNLNRNLNDHLGKVDAFPQSKALKDLETRKIKTLPPIKGLDIKDLGDDKISINGKTYDKDFDADEIKRIIGNPGVGNQVKSVGGGQTGAVSGTKNKGSAGATIGGGGMDIGIKGSGAVSGDKGKSIGSTDKPGEWVGGQEWDLPKSKGETGAGTITGPEVDIKGQSIGKTGTQSNTISKDIAIPKQGNLVRTMPPPPPPIAQAPQGPKYRKYDPKKDKDIIYKGKVAPKNVVDFKAIKTGVGGMADRLRIK